MGNVQTVQIVGNGNENPLVESTKDGSSQVIMDVIEGREVTEETLDRIPHFRCAPAHDHNDQKNLLARLLYHRFYVWSAFLYADVVTHYFELVKDKRDRITPEALCEIKPLFNGVIKDFVCSNIKQGSTSPGGMRYLGATTLTVEEIRGHATKFGLLFAEIFGEAPNFQVTIDYNKKAVQFVDAMNAFYQKYKADGFTDEVRNLFHKAQALNPDPITPEEGLRALKCYEDFTDEQRMNMRGDFPTEDEVNIVALLTQCAPVVGRDGNESSDEKI